MSGKLHFTGIGGAGMAPLAELALARGDQVSGSDELDNPKCRRLAVLGAKIEAAAKDVELADAEKAAADAAVETSLANAAKEASEAVSEAGSGKAGTGGGGRIASDRLTRIGGYTGGGSSPMKTSEDLLRKANEQRAELIAAWRDRNVGTFG